MAILDIDPVTDNVWRISRINVPAKFRNQGHGTNLLKECLCDADRENITIVLEPMPYDDYPNAYNDLVSFYKNVGFEYSERNEDVEGIMIRYPKQKS